MVDWPFSKEQIDRLRHVTYREFLIEKRLGGKRAIYAPPKELKIVQKFILKEFLERLPVHKCAHGFVKGKSIVTNAEQHVGADILVNLDIKDFYPSFTKQMVRDFFAQHSFFGVDELTDLCTYKGTLPQGAVTSPQLANLIFAPIDAKLYALADEFGFTYTRYADDMTFSAGSFYNVEKEMLDRVVYVLDEHNFVLQEEKTYIAKTTDRMVVTGLLINPAEEDDLPVVRARREQWRALRAGVHDWFADTPKMSWHQLRSMCAYLSMTDPAKVEPYVKRLETVPKEERS